MSNVQDKLTTILARNLKQFIGEINDLATRSALINSTYAEINEDIYLMRDLGNFSIVCNKTNNPKEVVEECKLRASIEGENRQGEPFAVRLEVNPFETYANY